MQAPGKRQATYNYGNAQMKTTIVKLPKALYGIRCCHSSELGDALATGRVFPVQRQCCISRTSADPKQWQTEIGPAPVPMRLSPPGSAFDAQLAATTASLDVAPALLPIALSFDVQYLPNSRYQSASTQ